MGSRGRVLLIEDEPELVEALAMRLGQAGFELLAATDGRRGLELASAKGPDIILLDILLAGMSGYQICELLKSSPATWSIPVIFLSGDIRPETRRRARAVGGVGFVEKPYDPTELLRTLDAALGRLPDPA